MTWPTSVFMGGYAPYVWGSYFLTLIALSGELWLLVRRNRRWPERMEVRPPANGRDVSR